MACGFITSACFNINALFINDVVNNWAWCYAPANFIIGGGLLSTSRESKGSALTSKLGGSILYPKAQRAYIPSVRDPISTSFDMQYSTTMMSSPFIII